MNRAKSEYDKNIIKQEEIINNLNMDKLVYIIRSNCNIELFVAVKPSDIIKDGNSIEAGVHVHIHPDTSVPLSSLNARYSNNISDFMKPLYLT